ncbi:MAG TPA: NAD(P)H-dependent oxidoreductase [Kiritimatiellia bacterium]|nr:NAD(P)H-dependent oxidoreductase [Kiritimatiellia bacterium]HPS07591.1 NAD(P)H-dependent oxidoreductase [Kiritimatiellia bacterium]
MKKILILTASPKANGNTNTMASAFEAAAIKKGASVTRLDLNAVRGTGCCACMACRKTSDRCVLKDGVAEVLEAFRTTDVLVLAAPVWWLDIPVSMRRFVERWYSLVDAAFAPRLPEGKSAVLLLSQGADEDSFKDLPARYTEMLNWLGITEVHTVRHCAADENPIRESGVLDAVATLAQTVA